MIRRENKMLTSTTGATFSECLRYRWTLYRVFDTGPMVNFLMLNPSTADDITNDPTVERCRRRSETLGFGGLIVTNIFAWRSTDPSVLSKLPDPVGVENDAAIKESASQCAMVICAWGRHGKIMDRAAVVLNMLREFCPEKLHALKLSKDGTPWHPLYLPYELKPQAFR